MKMFIWNNPLGIGYGDSVLIVVADTLEEARYIAKSQSQNSEYPFMAPVNVDDMEPDYVRDVPCAEFREWSE